MSCATINKEDLTLKEYNSLCPTHGLLDDVNFEEIKYYKDDNGQIYELSICTDGSLNKKVQALENIQNKQQLLKNFGF